MYKNGPGYVPWYNVVYLNTRPVSFHTVKGKHIYELTRDKKHESKEIFKQRKKKFISTLLEIYVPALIARLDEIKANPDTCTKKELKKQLKNLPKRIEKYSKWLEKRRNQQGEKNEGLSQ
ncbi:MAG: hypothetical protein JW891_04350 [Candidatus Lokiarchaeota archaeon]|nr:hypothetical protein [Candidatus Lokiarchaeota archaeon]